MARNTKLGSRKTPNKFCIAALFICLLISRLTFAYTDQVVVETPNMVKTIYDVRIHAFIRHLYEDQKIIDAGEDAWMKNFQTECDNYIQQYLAQNYVAENASSIKPSDEDIKQAIDKINSVFKDVAAKKSAFQKLNMTDNDVQLWVSGRLAFDKFIVNTIQNRVIVTDEKINSHYKTWKTERFGNKPQNQIQQKVRDDLVQTLQKEEFEKWIDQEKRRQKMIVKTVISS